jgi:hypothetical protein
MRVKIGKNVRILRFFKSVLIYYKIQKLLYKNAFNIALLSDVKILNGVINYNLQVTFLMRKILIR